MDAVSPPPWTAKREAVNGVFKKRPPPGRWSLWAGCARPRRCGKPSGEPPPPRGFPHLRQDPRAYLLSGLGIFPHPLGQVTRPVVHQDTPAFKQVRAGIGRLENLQGAATQRHPVLAVCLGPPGRDGPHPLVGRRESETPGQGLRTSKPGSTGQIGPRFGPDWVRKPGALPAIYDRLLPPPAPQQSYRKARTGFSKPEEADRYSCFLHQHSSADCRIARISQANRLCRVPKLLRKAAHDAEHVAKLEELGWEWRPFLECQVEGGPCLGEWIGEFLDGWWALPSALSLRGLGDIPGLRSVEMAAS